MDSAVIHGGGGVNCTTTSTLSLSNVAITSSSAPDLSGGGLAYGSSGNCDFGADGGADDHSPADLCLRDSSTAVEYGDAASFVCDAHACN